MATTLSDPPRDAPAPPAAAPPAAPSPRPRARRGPALVVAALALAAAAWAGREWVFGRTHVSTDNAQVDGHLTPIAPKVQGFVARVLVDDNQPVRAGDTLVVLDDRDLVVRLRQAEAELATAEAAVGSARRAGQARAQLAMSQAQAAGAEATIASAEAALRQAEADLARYRGLAERRIVAAQQLDAAQAAYDAARANLEAARKQATAMTSQVTMMDAALGAATARQAAARAILDNARLQLSYAVLRAPAAGVVARRAVEPGELVQVGQQLLTLIPLEDVWVTANLKETQLADVTPGDPVEFTVDAYPGRRFRGTVASVSPATGATFALLPPDNATGNFTKVVQRVPVKVTIDRASLGGAALRPGMSVVATITTK